MFEGQPKGLYALALANTGERFGYYTMLAIFTLFLQAKFGFTAATTSTIFASFLAGVYFMPLIGGILADKFGYGKMVTTGIVIMFAGYVLLAIPMATNIGLYSMFGALALIALGTGLFKGNLQVMVGNLYDAPEYSAKRDTAFSLFYMAINIGALFAPTAATAMTNYVLGKAGFSYVPQIPSLAHQFLDGTITADGEATLTAMQNAQNFTGSMADFCTTYIDKLSEAYNYGFGVACISLVASMAIYVIFRSTFKHADYNSKQAKPANVHEEELTPAQTKERIVALLDEAGLDAPTLPEVGEQLQLDRDTMTRALRELSLNRSIVKIERDVALSAAAEAHARELVAAAIADAGGAATTSVLREALGVSRKRAISILEHLDVVRFTVLDKDAGGLRSLR